MTPIRAIIVGSDRCEAEGISDRASAPVLAICRKLVEAGYDPATPLHAYRGDVLCLKVRTIGEGVNLEIGEAGFHRRHDWCAAPPVPRAASPMRSDEADASTSGGHLKDAPVSAATAEMCRSRAA